MKFTSIAVLALVGAVSAEQVKKMNGGFSAMVDDQGYVVFKQELT